MFGGHCRLPRGTPLTDLASQSHYAHIPAVCPPVLSPHQGRCTRENCKYLHPPPHLKTQLEINGRNNLIQQKAAAAMLAQQMQFMLPGTQLQPIVSKAHQNYNLLMNANTKKSKSLWTVMILNCQWLRLIQVFKRKCKTLFSDYILYFILMLICFIE